MNIVVKGFAAFTLLFMPVWEFWISSIYFQQWSKTKPVVQTNSFFETFYSQQTATSELTSPCSLSIASFIQRGQQWSLFSNCLLTHVPWIQTTMHFRPLCWFSVVGRGWGSSIRKVEVSFKSGKPYSTVLPPEDGTLVWMLASHGRSQTSAGFVWYISL